MARADYSVPHEIALRAVLTRSDPCRMPIESRVNLIDTVWPQLVVSEHAESAVS
jgi:N-acetylmuramoyl-L-alanine amidase